jgi:hypothetical protein
MWTQVRVLLPSVQSRLYGAGPNVAGLRRLAIMRPVGWILIEAYKVEMVAEGLKFLPVMFRVWWRDAVRQRWRK